MKPIIVILKQKGNSGKEDLPVSPPERPVIKPAFVPEKEKNVPFYPVPEIQPIPQPEIKPVKRDQDHNAE